jgi:hypothetical protein
MTGTAISQFQIPNVVGQQPLGDFGGTWFNSANLNENDTRQSLLNGIQFDGAYRLNDQHTLRAGVAVSGEETQVNNTSTVLPLAPDGTPLPLPFNVTDYNSKIGWNQKPARFRSLYLPADFHPKRSRKDATSARPSPVLADNSYR